MTKYDLIIVLGSLPDPETWEFPQQVYDCLDRAKQLLDTSQAPFIATSGKWSIALDSIGLRQPFRECDAMADYLLSKGVPRTEILKEGTSKDTISNLYYLKTEFLIPREMKHLLFVVAKFRIPRLKFLCERILGPEYKVNFEPIECEVGTTYDEPNTFKIQKEFLKPMKSGDHAWLASKFYSASMYQYLDKRDKEKYQHLYKK
jgi:uncharacterized SAM-binding protein YcdF (DUF218 family)